MAEIGDVNPLHPIWPKRPTEKVTPGERSNDASNNKEQKQREHDKDQDDEPHIDEYA